jgi:SAM-dependent methyltransferase
MAENTHADPLVPPIHLMFDGTVTAEDFINIGQGFLNEYLIKRARLRQNERVLDLGSGIGQKARVLTGYLDANGSYEGLDIVPEGIAWCREAYARFPNFRFTLAQDLYSSHYNPKGQVSAREYRLPYNDGDFDLVFLASVFTHLVPDEITNYVGEISRVLRPGGRCVVSAFLLNTETRRQIERGENKIAFPVDRGSYRLMSDENPSMAVALDEEFLRDTLARAGLRTCEIAYGFWSGVADLLQALQDCIIARKAP